MPPPLHLLVHKIPQGLGVSLHFNRRLDGFVFGRIVENLSHQPLHPAPLHKQIENVPVIVLVYPDDNDSRIIASRSFADSWVYCHKSVKVLSSDLPFLETVEVVTLESGRLFWNGI